MNNPHLHHKKTIKRRMNNKSFQSRLRKNWISELNFKINLMNLYDTKDFFFIRSKDSIFPGIKTLVIEKSTTCITIVNDDKLLNTMQR